MALRLCTFLLIVVAGLCSTGSARATLYLHVPLSVHIDTSTCIVVARLIDPRSGKRQTGKRWMTGTLQVESIVWSLRKAGTSLPLEWRSGRSEDFYLSLAGERVLWLLKPDWDGRLGIDHPGRAIPIEDPADIEHHLRELRETRDPSPRTRLVARYLESQLPFRTGLQPR